MNLPEGWTDDMNVDVRPGCTTTELVQVIMDGLLGRTISDAFVIRVREQFGLSQAVADLAFDRVQAGVIRALTTRRDNRPDLKKDPLAWQAFQAVWKTLPRRYRFLGSRKCGGPWSQWFEESRAAVKQAETRDC